MTERKVKYENVVVTEITPDLHFFTQVQENGAKLESLMSKLRQDFQAQPPVSGSYTPRRGDICAAKFSEDQEWYRAKVDRVQGANCLIKYIDYGNTEVCLIFNRKIRSMQVP